MLQTYLSCRCQNSFSCCTSSLYSRGRICLCVGVDFPSNISNLPTTDLIAHKRFLVYQILHCSSSHSVSFALVNCCDRSRSLFACSCPLTGNNFGSSKPT